MKALTVNLGPEAFNGAVNLTKTVINGYTHIAELALGEGYFADFRASEAYNITPLVGYSESEKAGAFIGGLIGGKALEKFGNYGVVFDSIDVKGVPKSQAGAVSVPRIVTPEEVAQLRSGTPIVQTPTYTGDVDAPDFVGPRMPASATNTSRMASDVGGFIGTVDESFINLSQQAKMSKAFERIESSFGSGYANKIKELYGSVRQGTFSSSTDLGSFTASGKKPLILLNENIGNADVLDLAPDFRTPG